MNLFAKTKNSFQCFILGMGILFLFSWNSSAQNLPVIQNQISINYKDTLNRYYSTESNIVITPLASPIDLWVTKTAPTSTLAGEIATYTITYGNKGTVTAYNVQIVDRFPQEMEAIIYQDSDYSLNFDPITKLGTWNVDILPPGTYSFKISIRIRMDALGTITNTVRIESTTPEAYLYLLNNYSTATSQIKLKDIDLWVTKTAPTSTLAGGIATYTITYGNSGNLPAMNVRLIAQFPDEMQTIINGTSGLVFDPVFKRGTWNLGNLNPAATRSFNLAICIKDNVRGSTTITNIMRIECLDVESNYTNNQSTASTHIIDTDMEITKYGNSSVITGEKIIYTVYYRNKGNTNAENVTITDYFPPGVKYSTDTSGVIPSVTGSGTLSSPHIVTWNIGTETFSYGKQFQITAIVTEELPASPSLSAQIDNVIKVRTTSPETGYNNNQATSTTLVEAPQSNLSIYKYVTREAISGQEINYTIYCYNHGNVPAGSVTVTDYLPEGLVYRGCSGIGSPTIGSTSSGQILTWQLGTLSKWYAKQFQLTALITKPASSTVQNIVEITSSTRDKDYSDNRATATVHVNQPFIDLSIYKYGPSEINPGLNIIKYTIGYRNNSNVPVGSVTIVDTYTFSEPASGTLIYDSDTSGFAADTQTKNQITWFVGTVTPYESNYFYLTLVVNDVPGSTTLTNEIRISSDLVADSNSDNNFYSCTTHVKYPKIDLDIRKVGPRNILPGSDITYTIQYRNLGSIDAGSTTITDTLPIGVSYVSDTSGVTPTISGTPTQVIWEFGTRAMVGSRNWVLFQLKGKVAPNIPASTTLTNKVEISTLDVETNYNNNTSTYNTLVVPAKADLRIKKYKYRPKEVTPGCELTYCLAYDNLYGNVPATNTVIIDTLPGSVTFVSCTGNGTVTNDGKVRWDIGTLTNRGSDYRYLTVRVNEDVIGSLTNIVEITSDTTDLDTSNNRATCTVGVVDWYADVYIVKSGPADIQKGERLKYYIRYGNYGNIPATSTTIIDTLPPGVTYATDTSGFLLTTTEGRTLTWQVGTLSSMIWGYFYLYVDVVGQDLKASNTITNNIEIKTNTYEKNKTNNRSIWKTHILSKDVDIGIWKYCPKQVAQGQEFEYRITYRNLSKTSAENVRISDVLPEELTYLSDTSGKTYTMIGNNIIWNIGTLSPWDSKDFRLRVKVKGNANASSTITNLIKITTSNPDIDTRNNNATASTHICLPEPELEVRKWQYQREVTAGQMMDYYIRYSNKGKGDAGSVTITDTLPIGVRYVSDNSGFTPVISGSKLIWQVGTLSVNNHNNFRLKVLVDKYIPASTTLTNIIEISTPYHQSSDRDTCTTYVKEPITDVLIYKSGYNEVRYGTRFTYEIIYNNNSVSEAEGVEIKDILDPRLIYVSDTSGLRQTRMGNEIIWYVGTMSAWASGYFLLTVEVPYSVQASSTLTNVIEITTLTPESKYNNNRATVTTHVGTPTVDVGIEKKGDDARPGFDKRYHITYYNRGTEKAVDVVIIDKLPPEVQYLSSNPAGNYDSTNHTVTWNIEELGPQTTKYATIDVKIPVTQKCGVNLYNYIEIKTSLPESDYLNNKFTEIETVVTSIDPNDKLVNPQKYIRDNELLNYTIRFENQATASASAILITIEDQLPTELDWTSLMFGQIKIGEGTYTLENFDKGSLSCSYDVGSGTIRWKFDFKRDNGLPPNIIPPEGEGYVSFSIRAKQGLSAGTKITNVASIRFDYNAPMDTPPVTNIVDLNMPSSTVAPLAQYQTSTRFVVHWSGTDTAGNQAGEIENYTIYVSDNGGTFTKWLEETMETSGTFTGRTGHSYSFYCVATDRAKNSEAKTPRAEAFTSLTLPKHFVISTLTTTEIYSGGTLPLTLSIYDSEKQLVTDYIGTATLRDKLGTVGTAVFNSTGTWSGDVVILQSPNGGTNTIIAEAEGIISAVSETFRVLINRKVGGTVTLWTPGVGTTTIRFGTSTIFDEKGGVLLDFYITIDCLPPAGIAMSEGGVIQSLRSIYAYDRNHSPLKGTFTPIAYLEIPYPDANQDGFVDGTRIKETTLRLYVWENDNWKEIEGTVVDKTRNIVYCNINHLTTFMPIGFLLAPSTLGNVAVYPNPFKPNSGLGHEYITFGSKQGIDRRLTEYATIKIFTISGDLVRTLNVVPEDNGQKVWDARNDSGREVASGIYIYLITNPQGEKCIGKVAIIR